MLSKLAMDRPVMALPASSIADDWGQGRDDAGRTSDTSSAAAQYGGSERTTYGQTGGYPDPTTRRDWQGARDDGDTTGTGEKPSVTSKVKGTSSLVWGCVGAVGAR